MSRYRDRRGRFASADHPDVRAQVIAEGIVGVAVMVILLAFCVLALLNCGGPGLPGCK